MTRGITEERLIQLCKKHAFISFLRNECQELNPRQPIETAPRKNGKVIILHFENRPTCAAFWDLVLGDWHLFAAYRDEPPTHWEYLPGDGP